MAFGINQLKQRGGRPRKPGKRKPSGDLCEQVDLGTPELLRHRAMMINPALMDARVDDIMKASASRDQRASYALGILFARGLIDEYQHAVGCRYQRLCNIARYYPQERPSILAGLVKSPNAGGDKPAEHDETPEERFERNRVQYLDIQRILAKQPVPVRKMVDNVSLFGMMPRDNEMNDLKAGLTVLQRFFKEMLS